MTGRLKGGIKQSKCWLLPGRPAAQMPKGRDGSCCPEKEGEGGPHRAQQDLKVLVWEERTSTRDFWSCCWASSMGREVLVQGAQDLPMEDGAGCVLLLVWRREARDDEGRQIKADHSSV